MKQKLVALIALSLLFAQSESTRAARGNARRAAGTRARTSNVRVTGTTTTITATAADTTSVSDDYSKPAPITDAVAKRKCDQMVANKLKSDKDRKKTYKSSADAYANLVLPTYEEAPNSANDTFCANFIEDSVAKLWNDFDSYAESSKKFCNIAKARALAAGQCYQYAISEVQLKPRLGFDVFSAEELDPYCGTDAIKNLYKQQFAEELDSKDVGTSLTRPFSKVGGSGWSNLAKYGNVLDLKLDVRSAEWPQDITQLVNSINNQGKIACGESFVADIMPTMSKLDNTSSIEKRINEKGLLAGGKDWIVDQIGAITGTNRAEEMKAGKTKEERELEEAKKKLIKIDDEYKKLTGSDQTSPEEAKRKYEEVRNRINAKQGEVNEKLTKEDINTVADVEAALKELESAIKTAKNNKQQDDTPTDDSKSSSNQGVEK